MEKIKYLINKYKEIFLYVLVGAATTGVNFIVFIFMRKWGFGLISANTSAFVVAVLSAYFSNDKIVFKTKKKNTLAEEMNKIFKFCSLRVGSFIVEMILLLILVKIIPFELICKVVISFIIIILNYIISKKAIFNK